LIKIKMKIIKINTIYICGVFYIAKIIIFPIYLLAV
jgi:hypothetical protein